jgi:beta-phosphoglucomutase-like phosphatase (HAD superfamily)
MDVRLKRTVGRLLRRDRPDLGRAGEHALGVVPAAAAVFEDTLAGVAAGGAGGSGCVVGVDRVGQAEALRVHGGDLVVADLAEVLER